MTSDRAVASTVLDIIHKDYIAYINSQKYREAGALQEAIKHICEHYKILYVLPPVVPLSYNAPDSVPICRLPEAVCTPISSPTIIKLE